MIQKLFAFACILLLLTIAIKSNAQYSGFSLKEAIELLNASRSHVFGLIDKKGLIYLGKDEDVDVFTNSGGAGKLKLEFTFDRSKVKIITWTENLYYARGMVNDIINSDFVLIDKAGIMWRYVDYNQSLILNFFDHSNRGYLMLNLSRQVEKESLKAKPVPTNIDSHKPRAIIPRRKSS